VENTGHLAAVQRTSRRHSGAHRLTQNIIYSRHALNSNLAQMPCFTDYLVNERPHLKDCFRKPQRPAQRANNLSNDNSDYLPSSFILEKAQMFYHENHGGGDASPYVVDALTLLFLLPAFLVYMLFYVVSNINDCFCSTAEELTPCRSGSLYQYAGERPVPNRRLL